jgi:hypothetical protein
MNEGDWVMTNSYVGKLDAIGGMYCKVLVANDTGAYHAILAPIEEVRVIPKEVADIMRSV